jgi:hypothetical protein
MMELILALECHMMVLLQVFVCHMMELIPELECHMMGSILVPGSLTLEHQYMVRL